MFAWIWPNLDPEGRIGATPMRQDSPPSLPAALLLLLMAVAVWPSFGAERMAAEASPAASAVLERFIVKSWKIQRVAPRSLSEKCCAMHLKDRTLA